MQTSLDFYTGPELKAEGQQRVFGNLGAPWRSRVMGLLGTIAREHNELTADTLREACLRHGIEEPHHPNAWGSLFTTAAKNGLIEKAGYQPSEFPGNHARVLTVWRSLVYGGRA